MQSILRWSIENSTPYDSAPDDHPPAERKDLDPGIIDAILGKPDSVQMKEDMSVATDANRSEDERIDALDHLEMLIEHIDNANDLVKLGLWEPLQALATAESSTTNIKTQALWVIGTALQNNPLAQDVYLSYDPLPALLSFLDYSTSTSISTRAKAIYAISGLLKHNTPAVEVLDRPEVDGWTKLQNALQDPSIAVRRKVVFLLSSLLQPSVPASSSSTGPAPPNAPRIGGGVTGSTAVTAVTSTAEPNILTPERAADPSNPIFANSHAAHLQNPSRTSTSQLTLLAFQKHNILDTIISLLTTPLPHGEDGENVEPDADFEEKSIHLLQVYAVACQGSLSKPQKGQLMSWIQTEKQQAVGEKQLLERWNLSREDYAALVGNLV